MVRFLCALVFLATTAACFATVPKRARRPVRRAAVKADKRTLGVAPVAVTPAAFVDKEAVQVADNIYLVGKGIFRCVQAPTKLGRMSREVTTGLVEALRERSGFADVVVVSDPKQKVDLLVEAKLRRYDACVQVRRDDLRAGQRAALDGMDAKTVADGTDLSGTASVLADVFGLAGLAIGSMVEGSSEQRGSAFADVVLSDVRLVDRNEQDRVLWKRGIVEGRGRARIVNDRSEEILADKAIASAAGELQKKIARVLSGASPTGLLPGGRAFRDPDCRCKAPTTAVIIALTDDPAITKKSLATLAKTKLPEGYPMVMHTDELGVLKDSIEGVATVIGLFADVDDAAAWTRRWGDRLPPMAMIPLRPRGWKPAENARRVIHVAKGEPVPAFTAEAIDAGAAEPSCTLAAGSFYFDTARDAVREGWAPVRCGADRAFIEIAHVDNGTCSKRCQRN